MNRWRLHTKVMRLEGGLRALYYEVQPLPINGERAITLKVRIKLCHIIIKLCHVIIKLCHVIIKLCHVIIKLCHIIIILFLFFFILFFFLNPWTSQKYIKKG